MGQAKLRGTKEQRTEEAIKARDELIRERQARADEAEYKRNQEIARRWANMTPEERARRLENAKQEAETYGFLAGEFGHDAADLLMRVGRKR